MALASGTRVGIYEVTAKIGEGGMGEVYRARDARLDREVAVKILPETLVADPSALLRFEQEAKAVAALSHPNIVAIHDVGKSSGLSYVVLELLEGETLRAALERGPLPLRKAIDYARQLAHGLAAAHDRSVVHRDLKPENVFLTVVGQVKILDFGLAKMRSQPDSSETSTELVKTQVGTVMGTMGYMSPEQVRGEAIDHRTDLFSFGLVLYEMVTGRRAFQKDSSADVISAILNEDPEELSTFQPSVAPGLVRIVRRCLEKQRGERFQSARDLAFALESIADDLKRNSDSWPTPAHGLDSATPSSGVVPAVFDTPVAESSGGLEPNLGSRESPPAAANAPSTPPMGSDVSGATSGSTDRGVSTGRILFGTTTARSGPNRDLGLNMVEGMRTSFAAVNAAGGIHGRKLDLVVLNDGYEPERALKNMVELLEEREVFAVVGNVGTPTARVTVPYAVANNLLFFGAETGASLLRKDPPERYVFNYRASYADETAAIVDYFVEIKGVPAEGIAVFGQKDDYGDDGFRGVARRLRRQGVKQDDIIRVGYERNTVDVDEAVETIQQHRDRVSAIVMLGTYRAVAHFVQRVKDEKLDCEFHAVSGVSADDLAQEFRDRGGHYGEGVIVTQVVPPPDAMATGVIRYRKFLKEHFPEAEPGYISLEGFVSAEILVEGLRRVGPDLTTEKLIDALYTIKDLDFGVGAIMGFGPSRHQASHKVWATVLDDQGRFSVLDLDP
jgi:serine/threonine protein kinase